jgi:hypothetical protein
VTQTVGNIVLPGPCKVFIAAYSAASLQTAPASSVAYGSDWGGTWTEVGYTKGGVMLKPEVEHLSVEVDQVNAPVADAIISQTASVTFAAAEATLTNIKQALGYGTVTSGSTESTLGVSGADYFPTYYTVGFEQYAPGADSGDSWYRRVIVWKALPKGEIELKADKGEEQLVAYTLEARYETQAASTERLWKVIDRGVD